jgi:hypothetical protein
MTVGELLAETFEKVMVMEYSPQFSSLIGATFGEEDEIMTRACPSCSRVNESR